MRHLVRMAVICLVALAGMTASVFIAQPTGAGATPAEAGAPEPALVVVFNRPIIILRAPIFGLSPTQRVERAQERIGAMLDQEPIPPVSRNPITEGVLIRVGDRDALVVMPGDVDLIAGETFDELVARTVQRLESVITDIQEQRQWPFLIRAAGAVLAATALFILAVAGILRFRRWLLDLSARFKESASGRLQKSGLDSLGPVANAPRIAAGLAVSAVLAFCSYFWLVFCLEQFPYTEPWGRGLGAFLVSTLSRLALGVVNAVPNLFVVVVIVLATRFAVKVVRSFFSAVEESRAKVAWLDPDAARATSQIVAVLVWMFALVMIYPYLPGSGSMAFQGMSLLLGVLVSLGATSLVGQFTSGLVLMYSRAVRAGEYVQFGEHEGTVVSLGFLSTKIQTKKNEEIHVPSSVLLGATVKNFSRMAESHKLILYTSVTIGYNAPWRQVHALLTEAAGRTPGLYKTPAPFVLQTALSDFYVEYQLNAYLEQPDQRLEALALLHTNIQDLFNEHGVQIMSPHYRADTAEPVVVPKANWYAPPARPPENKS